jgi:hypothetical protein
MRLDTSGNLGLGVTPSAWGASRSAIDMGANAYVGGTALSHLTNNVFFNGTNFIYKTTAATGMYQIAGAAHQWYSAASGTAGNAITFTQAMTLDASGNLGIGTASPAQKLDVNNGANSTFIRVASTQNASGFDFGVGGSGDSTAYIFNRNNTPISFATNSTERMRITAAGGFSVGTTADPGAGAIYATGNITAYYSSDRTLKENIKDVDDALSIVSAIGSKTFDWTDAYIASKGGEDGYFVQKSDFGVVAQDVQEVFPQAVRTREDGTLAVDYEKLSTLAFGAIKELLKRVEVLESK